MKVFVTDAATMAGCAVVEKLREQGHTVVAGVQGGKSIPEAGAQVVSLELLDPQSVYDAIEGCHSVVLSVPLAESMKKQGNIVVQAAIQAGVERIVCCSCLGASFDAHWRLGREYGFVDQVVEESGIDFTILRPNILMQELVPCRAQEGETSSHLLLPYGGGKVSFMDAQDLGACVVAVLDSFPEHVGKTYVLTGPESLSGMDVARVLSDKTGQSLEYKSQDEEEYVQSLNRAGVDGWSTQMLVSRSRIVRRDMAWNVTGAVEHLTGNKARAFTEVVGSALGKKG